MLRISILFAFLVPLPIATAQVAQPWSLTVDQSPLADSAAASIVDATGAITFAGAIQTTTGGFPFPPPELFGVVARVSPQGALLWHRTHRLPGHTRTIFTTLAAGPADSFYVAGWSGNGVIIDGVIARYAADGTLLWATPYNHGGDYENLRAIATDPSGDLWVVGDTTPPGNVPSDLVVLRVNPSGSIVFATTWNGTTSQHDGGYDVAPDGQGGAYVAGRTNSDIASSIALWRVDAAGGVQWARAIQQNTSYGFGVAVDAAGDAYVCGGLGIGGLADQQYVLAKYDPSGNLLWQRTSVDGHHPRGIATRVAIDARGDVVTAGRRGPTANYTNLFVEKRDAGGNRIWSFDGSDGRADTLLLDAAGEIAVAGRIGEPGNPLITQALALRLDRDGRALWSRAFGTLAVEDFGTGLGFGPLGSFLFTATVRDGNDFNVLLKRFDETSVPFCFGDGSGTACPCGNATPASEREGCASSLGHGGRLTADGTASLAFDSLTLRGSGMPDASALYFQGTTQVGAGAGATFGDGLRCAGGSIVRLKTVVNVTGASQFPAAGDPQVSVRGQIGAPGTRAYQVWYRNAAPFCTNDTFNLSNGVLVTWTN